MQSNMVNRAHLHISIVLCIVISCMAKVGWLLRQKRTVIETWVLSVIKQFSTNPQFILHHSTKLASFNYMLWPYMLGTGLDDSASSERGGRGAVHDSLCTCTSSADVVCSPPCHPLTCS